jgi:hypothetical protein
LRHQSVRDYLLSPEGHVPPQGLADVHETIGRYYLAQAARGGWRSVEPYGLAFVVRHLLKAHDAETKPECVAEGVSLLTDLRYLSATLGDRPPATNGRGGEGRTR